MVDIKQNEMKKIAPLFQDWEETMIWSCLQGCMGQAWADDAAAPTAALIRTGDLFFLAGDAASPAAGELAGHIPEDFRSEYALLAPREEAWARVIERVYGERAERGVRYAIKKEPEVFDRKKLAAFCADLPAGYRLRPIDGELYRLARQEEWSRDLVSQFATPEEYAVRGLGVAALYGGSLAAGASSYTVYHGGIEIEIDTKEEHRRKGLALACGAALILRCLDRGLYPSWDAANKASVALSQKLGYHFSHEYPYYAVKVRETA